MGSGTDLVPSQAAANLALTYAVQGDTALAQEWLSRHRQFDTSHWPGNYAVGIGAHVAAGLLALDRHKGTQIVSARDFAALFA